MTNHILSFRIECDWVGPAGRFVCVYNLVTNFIPCHLCGFSFSTDLFFHHSNTPMTFYDANMVVNGAAIVHSSFSISVLFNGIFYRNHQNSHLWLMDALFFSAIGLVWRMLAGFMFRAVFSLSITKTARNRDKSKMRHSVQCIYASFGFGVTDFQQTLTITRFGLKCVFSLSDRYFTTVAATKLAIDLNEPKQNRQQFKMNRSRHDQNWSPIVSKLGNTVITVLWQLKIYFVAEIPEYAFILEISLE